MTPCVYILAKYARRSQLYAAGEQIQQIPGLVRWDAVDGHYDVVAVAKDQSQNSDIIAAFRKTEGLAEIKTIIVVKGEEALKLFDSDLCHSYVFLETEAAARNDLLKQIGEIEEVSYISPLMEGKSGELDIVAFLTAESFAILDKIILNKIQPLDGILRMKKASLIESSLK